MREQHGGLMHRVREIRAEVYGDHGIETLAQEMKLPVPTWVHFEDGVTMPGEVILHFIELTGVEPHWLLTGEGAKYRRRTAREA
jgi:hypothetical protein